jgi:UDP-GlcNAc:undecaprenyl-phosphate GlcNAc-1-phosphate transferase
MGPHFPTSGVIAAIAVGLGLQPVVVRLMLRRSILDIPNNRSSHAAPTPRGGGIAVVAAITVALLLDHRARLFAVPLLLFAGIGLLEDLRGASIPVRLVQQVLASAVAGVLFASVQHTGSRFLIVALSSTLWLTVYANAFNFMDGLNGMSAGHTILAGTVYAVAGWMERLPVLTVVGAAAAAAAATFLPWNAGHAKIFLGDVGSYGLGALLAATAAYGVMAGLRIEVAAAPVALYLTDTGWTLAKRWYKGEKWYEAHRLHAYQRLTDAGWSHQAVMVFTVTLAAVVSVGGFVSSQVSMPLRLAIDLLAVTLLAGYMTLPGILARRRPLRTEVTESIRGEQARHV